MFSPILLIPGFPLKGGNDVRGRGFPQIAFAGTSSAGMTKMSVVLDKKVITA